MNIIQTAAATVAFIGATGSGIMVVESRYVAASDFENFAGQYLRGELRDLEREIHNTEDPDLRDFLQEEYQELLEEYCAAYPDDARRCEEPE